MSSNRLIVLGVFSLLSPQDLVAQFSFTENVPLFQLGYHNQPNFNYQYHACSLATSGWSEWIPRSCNKCGQSRHRYCLGSYNGCGEWYCMGNRLNYCQTPCPTVRTTDPRVRVDPPHGNALVSLQGNALDLPHGGACGARVAFSCPECYRVVGSVSAECLPNSTWSHPAPSCSAVTCSPPLQINSGYVTWDSNCGGSAVYKCYYGYELIGQEESRCSGRGLWEPPDLPICIPVKCPHLTRPENGILIMLNRSFRARAFFRCRMGYELHGPRSVRCSASGSWSPAPPACVRSNSSSFWG